MKGSHIPMQSKKRFLAIQKQSLSIAAMRRIKVKAWSALYLLYVTPTVVSALALRGFLIPKGS